LTNAPPTVAITESRSLSPPDCENELISRPTSPTRLPIRVRTVDRKFWNPCDCHTLPPWASAHKLLVEGPLDLVLDQPLMFPWASAVACDQPDGVVGVAAFARELEGDGQAGRGADRRWRACS
jgi:hypothetical protein